MSTKVPTPSRIVQNPRLWPSSFSQPVTSQNTCIRTYIFKDGTKVEKFLNFVKKTFPNRKVDIKQQNDGSTSISLTTTYFQVNSNDKTTCQSICKKNFTPNQKPSYTNCLNLCSCLAYCKKSYPPDMSNYNVCLNRCYCFYNCPKSITEFGALGYKEKCYSECIINNAPRY